MNIVVRFSPELGLWIQQHLDAGHAPADLVREMQRQRMAPEAARAIVDAFVQARARGAPVPRDSVELPSPEAAAPVYRHEAPRLRPGTAIATADRIVRVAARAAQPMLAVLNNVLDADECAELIEMARPRLQPSTLVDPQTGRDVVTGLRSSLGMFFRPQENALVARLDRRIAELMNLPLAHGEGLQILHYPRGAGSAPHFDFLLPSNPANVASVARSGQRVSTMVCYLNDVPEGGETVFPETGWAVSPQRGHAVYFEYCNSLDQLDHASLHASSAVLRGEKWVATKWMRQRPFVSAAQAEAEAHAQERVAVAGMAASRGSR
jgi:prolyl 4-hydroxylase